MAPRPSPTREQLLEEANAARASKATAAVSPEATDLEEFLLDSSVAGLNSGYALHAQGPDVLRLTLSPSGRVFTRVTSLSPTTVWALLREMPEQGQALANLGVRALDIYLDFLGDCLGAAESALGTASAVA